MTDRGITLPSDAAQRRLALDQLRLQGRGLDRGVVTCRPVDDIAIGTKMYLSPVDIGAGSFVVNGIAAYGYDAGLAPAGSLYMALYRVQPVDLLPGNWKARLTGSVRVLLDGDEHEYVGNIKLPKTMERTAAAWLVGVSGTKAEIHCYGEALTPPPALCLGTVNTSDGTPPDTIMSSDVTYSRTIPYVALLTQAGMRFRGSDVR